MGNLLGSVSLPDATASERLDLSRTRRKLAAIAVVGAAYYLSARFGLDLSVVQHNVSPLWPPTGIALIAFLLAGPGVWPAVFAGALLANLPISTSPAWALVTAGGNTLAPLAAAALLERVGFRRELDRFRDALAIVIAALLGMTISATVGTAALVAEGSISGGSASGAWAVWWAGDAMGVLVVAPFLLAVVAPRTRRPIRPARAAEAAALFVVLLVVTWTVLEQDRNLLFLPLPLIGWAAWRFQLRGAAPAALLVAGTASWTAAHGIGPFGSGSLVVRMLTLQAFNTGVALCSFVFAAAVSERLRTRRQLEEAAVGLERRVAERTADLSNANVRLEAEIAERGRVQEQLRSSERLLAETQRIAHTGSWAWWIADDRVEWSEEMYRIYGYQDREPLTIARAMERVHPEDLERISGNLRGYLDERATRDLPSNEFRIVRPDGTIRTLLGKSRLLVGDDRVPVRLIGWVQDITEDKVAERERAIAETLQRSLLLERLPEVPGVAIAARYVPAGADLLVGGDWYDAVELPGGRLGLAIGDVAGHGLASASAMGQLRTALRAFAFEDPAPDRVLTRVNRIMRDWLEVDMATLLFAVFDPRTNELRFSNAGHPPPLVVTPGAGSDFVRGALAPPLGAAPAHERFEAATTTLAPGSTILLYTDGLIEGRGLSVSAGLARLQRWTGADAADLEPFLERVIEALVEQPASDDVAVLALRPSALGPGPFRIDVAPEPRRLEVLRHGIRRWLEAAGVPRGTAEDVLVACMEACTNVIRHAGAPGARFEIRLARRDGGVEATVRDRGTWRPEGPTGGGRGLELMRKLMDEVEILPRPDGTTVRMRRRVVPEPVPSDGSDGRSAGQEVRSGQDIPAHGS